MAEKKKPKVYVKTPRAVVGYNHLLKPDTEGQYADGKFKVELIFDEYPEAVKAKGIQVAAEEFPKIKAEKIKVLIKDGDELNEARVENEKEIRPVLVGKHVILAKSQYAPQILGPDRRPLPAGVEIRGGDIAVALLQPVGSEKPVRGSITFRLIGIQLVEKKNSEGRDYSNLFDDEGEGFGSETPDEAGGGIEESDLPF